MVEFTRLSLTLFSLDLLSTLASLIIASWMRSTIPLGEAGALPTFATRLPLLVYVFALFGWGLGLVSSRAYDPQRVLRWFNEASRVTTGAIAGTAMLAGALYFTYRDISRLQIIYFLFINLFLMLSMRASLRIYHRLLGRERPGWRKRILVLGAGDLGRKVAEVLLDHSRWGFELVGFLDDDPKKQGDRISDSKILGPIKDLENIVDSYRIEEVWVALPVRTFEKLSQIVADLEKLPVRIKVVPDYYSLALVQAKAEVFGGIPIIGLREPLITGLPRVIKRLFDLLVAVILFTMLSPFMVVIVLIIKLDSSGPAIFRQKRAGENAQPFDMFKFRTMISDPELNRQDLGEDISSHHLPHKHPEDPRVTRVGRFLRRYSLDELPQLINVIKGEMSLVGPRPELPWLVDRYDSWQRKRFAVPQGLTGWWQINGRSDKLMHLHTEDDLYYVYNYSLWLDIQILFRTPLAVIRGEGAF